MKLEEVLAGVFEVSPGGINDALALREIPSWDSMTHMVMIVQLEKDFDVQLTGDEIADLATVADIRKALAAHGKI